MEIAREKQLVITESMVVSELIESFREVFPFLKLEVMFNGKEASALYPFTQLCKLTSRRKLTEFAVHDEMTVKEVVDYFWENMGLQVCIARKLANLSVETAFTSQWTLRQQNKVGSEVFNDFE